MIKNDFYLSCKGENLHCAEWRPEGECRAVLQIVHGLVEYIERYSAFASFLCDRGVAVVGHDHPGHGKTARIKDDLGHIDMKSGSSLLVDCTERVAEYIRESYPGLPRYILGHSMGSFVVRRYMTLYSKDLAGAVVMGTGTPPTPVLFAGRIMASIVGAFKGERHPSNFLKNLSFSGYNSRFPKEEGPNAWLSRNLAEVKKYDSDPLCGYTFTAGGFRTLYDTLYSLARKNDHENIKKDLRVLIVSGADDPVGSYGKGPSDLCRLYGDLGLTDVSLKLYAGGRHEILNEVNREQVCLDIFDWITKEN